MDACMHACLPCGEDIKTEDCHFQRTGDWRGVSKGEMGPKILTLISDQSVINQHAYGFIFIF